MKQTNKIHIFRISAVILFITAFAGTLWSQQSSYTWLPPQNITALNSPENDFAPAWNIFENRLYFNSERSGKSMFYVSNLSDSLVFGEPRLLQDELNQLGNNQAYITFENPEIAYVSTYRMTDRRPYLNIFQTLLKKMRWTRPFPVDSLLWDNFTSHPTVSPDGSVMVFSRVVNAEEDADIDLWICYRQSNGSWGGLLSVSELNSGGDEITPFLKSRDTLYFASDGLGGPGGFDIYVSVFSEGIWQSPYPLNEINTIANESDFTILPDGIAVFASDRPGGTGELDLYYSVKTETADNTPVLESLLELNIAATVTNIVAKYSVSYSTFPVIPYIFPNAADNLVANLPGKHCAAYADIEPSVDTLYNNSPAYIGDRLAQNTRAVLNITFYIKPDNIESEQNMGIAEAQTKLKNYFENTWEIEPNRLFFDTQSMNNELAVFIKTPYFVAFSSDEPSVFGTVDCGIGSYDLTPPALEFYLNARPTALLKKWSCTLKIDDLDYGVINSGTELPKEPFIFDISDYQSEIAAADSVIVIFNALDTTNSSTNESFLVNVAHSQTKIKNLVNINGKDFEQFTLVLLQQQDLTQANAHKDIIKSISENARRVSGITVQYFADNDYTRNLASALKDALSAELLKDLPITAVYSASQTVPALSDTFKPFTFRILIEKK